MSRNLPIQIPITELWLLSYDTVGLPIWLDSIDRDDWEFITSVGNTSFRMDFRYETDAIAFKIKFGV